MEENNSTHVNWIDIFKKYKGLWVALAEDEKTVVASSKSAKEAYEKAKKKGIDVPIMLSVPESNNAYVGSRS
jgi:glycerol-3-phosphate dehydrogenase